ncbi:MULTISPECIES: hypothetical protein [Nostocales]|uniref:Uncharacterized protein n=4 Tax=Nostocales TaxID=1161 RepID=A0A8S9TAP9_9CYAN|nr:hypothetical protein [Tolypothrix bouteillei]KAF3888712.1 hypothetical protein DA73_0400026935 [Tolypothrix bouteillei VB521301]
MNSDLMPSSESSNLTASIEAQTNQDADTNAIVLAFASANENAVPSVPEPENLPESPGETACDGNFVSRQQPIPPPSEPMQYRAIGLVRGRYVASDEQFTQGKMVTSDGTELDAVLLGRIMSLVKNHLDLEAEHLWVVYPRTRQENDNLHLQIVGVWEPENLAQGRQVTDEQEDITSEDLPVPKENSLNSVLPSSEIPDGGFSVRGEVVYQSNEAGNLVIKIKQAPRKQNDKPKYFKLKLTAKLETKAVGKFWDFQVTRKADLLLVESGEVIADLPKKRKPPRKGGFKGGGRRPGGPGNKRPFAPRQRNGELQRPIRKNGDASTPIPSRPSPVSTKPTPKPVKRPKPTQE